MNTAALAQAVDAAYRRVTHARSHRYAIITRTLRAVEQEDYSKTAPLTEQYHRAMRAEWAARDAYQEARIAYLAALCK